MIIVSKWKWKSVQSCQRHESVTRPSLYYWKRKFQVSTHFVREFLLCPNVMKKKVMNVCNYLSGDAEWLCVYTNQGPCQKDSVNSLRNCGRFADKWRDNGRGIFPFRDIFRESSVIFRPLISAWVTRLEQIIKFSFFETTESLATNDDVRRQQDQIGLELE